MENDNDFSQKFINPRRSNKKHSILPTIFTSFISALIGAICAILIYVNLPSDSVSNEIADETTAKETSSTQVENLNLSQVSLTNYSDTAVYAANKVLPSMVSITVEYDINYFGMAQKATATGSGVIISEDRLYINK